MKTLQAVLIMVSLFSYKTFSADLQKANEQRLREDVIKITSTKKPRNYKNKEALKEVADTIRTVFKENSEHVETQTFKIKEGDEYENIIASFGPRDGERFIIGAHYDVHGNYPGADDNASGVAALLEISRLLKKEKTPLPHRIDLVAFSLEEVPFFATSDMGSVHHAKKLHAEKVKVKMMIAVEMIGYFSDKPNSQERPFPLQALYPSTGNFISVVGSLTDIKDTLKFKKLMKQGAPELAVESVAAPTSIPGVDFSDHRSFWEYDYPALMITDTAFYRNPHYHGPTDTPETLNYKKMTEVVQAIYFTALHFL